MLQWPMAVDKIYGTSNTEKRQPKRLQKQATKRPNTIENGPNNRTFSIHEYCRSIVCTREFLLKHSALLKSRFLWHRQKNGRKNYAFRDNGKPMIHIYRFIF